MRTLGSNPNKPLPPQASTPHPPSPSVINTRLKLPLVDFGQPVLLAETLFPPKAVAGAPFRFQINLRNTTSGLQEVAVAVGDTTGFVFSGMLLTIRV